jgi:hypothetical protein
VLILNGLVWDRVHGILTQSAQSSRRPGRGGSVLIWLIRAAATVLICTSPIWLGLKNMGLYGSTKAICSASSSVQISNFAPNIQKITGLFRDRLRFCREISPLRQFALVWKRSFFWRRQFDGMQYSRFHMFEGKEQPIVFTSRRLFPEVDSGGNTEVLGITSPDISDLYHRIQPLIVEMYLHIPDLCVQQETGEL